MSVRALGLAGRYEPYRLICQCLNIKRQVGVLLWEHRGWILRMASLIKIEKQHITVIPSDSHSGFYFPPFVETNGFETTDCLECLQILNILYMAGGSTLKLEIGHYALY